MDRLDVFNNILRDGLVPCFYHVDEGTCLEALRIGYENGLRALEFTNRGVGAYRIFSVMRHYSTQHCPDLALGAGTIGDKAVHGPLPKTKFLVAGDVTTKRDNLEKWFTAGATAVGLCSQLFKKDWLNTRSFLDLGGLIKEVVDTIHQIKNPAKHV